MTTIFVGKSISIGTCRAADPAHDNPSPMSRSVEFQDRNVGAVLAQKKAGVPGSRPREAKTTTARAFELLPSIAAHEILIGAV